MLDSLVRVSRRVGWETDRFATDPERMTGERPGPRDAGGRRALRAVLNSRTHAQSRASPAAAGHKQKSSVAEPANASRGYNTRARRSELPSPRAYDGSPTGRGALPAESAPAEEAATHPAGGSSREPRQPGRHPSDRLNSAGRLCGPIRLPLYGFTYS